MDDQFREYDEFDIRAHVGQRVACRFFMKTVVCPKLTEENGYTSHKEVAFAEIWQIGERDRWHVEAKTPYQYVADGLHEPRWYCAAEIWERQWEMFSADHSSDQIVGMRLEEWGRLSRSEAADLRGIGIRTVEELAAMPESAKKKLGFSANRYTDMAKRFVEEANGDAALQQRDQKIADLESKLHALASKIGEASAPAAEPPADASAAFDGWEDDALRAYLTDNGVTPDGRWGSARLRDEAGKVAAAAVASAA